MSTANKVIKSSSILVMLRLIMRGFGLISILILARLLTPEDFGIVAIAVTIIYFFEAASNFGAEAYILHKQNVSTDDLNTAWSVDIMIKTAFFLLLLVFADPIAGYFGKQELESVLYVLSLILLISGFKSPGMYVLKKELNYKSFFVVSVIQKVTSFVVVLTIAFTFKTYWALIIGSVVAALVLTVGSYRIHSFRPRFSLVCWDEQWQFSKWIFLRGITGYIRMQFDAFLVSLNFSASQMGGYHLMRHISIMPSTEIIAPAVEPLLAAFSKSSGDREGNAYQIRISLLIVTALALPMSVYMWGYSNPIVATLLGNQWLEFAPLLSFLAILFFSIAFIQVLTQSIVALGRVKQLFFFELFSLLMIVSVLISLSGNDLNQLALLRSLVGVLTAIILFVYTLLIIPINARYCGKIVSPVVYGAFLSHSIVIQIYSDTGETPFLDLIVTGAAFFFFYLLILCISYFGFFKKYPEWMFVSKKIIEVWKAFLNRGKRYASTD